ncbi:DUF222 domain-containing protein, partial [Ornithinimicrobium murale]|uniref:DUF222 domain-containing protein n=1 Tax=Ornithinimicrobium murale TaxID=1050153 RepID=UPI000E0E0319
MKQSGVEAKGWEQVPGPGVGVPEGELATGGAPEVLTAEGSAVAAGVLPEEVAAFVAWEAELAADPAEEVGADWALVGEVDEFLSRSGVGSAAEDLAGGLDAAVRGLGRVAGVGPAELVSVFDPAVSEGLEVVGALRCALDGVGFALAAEAEGRGLHTAVGLSLVDWLRVRCPWLSGPEACQVREVVRAGAKHWGRGLAQAVRDGEVPVYRAAKVARTMNRLEPSLDVDQQEAFAEIAAGAAGNHRISDRDLEVVCKKLLFDLLDEQPKEEAEKVAQEQRCVSRRQLGSGMTRFTIDAPDSDAALIDGVLTGPLAAPDPNPTPGSGQDSSAEGDGAEGGAGEGGVRSPGQRRFDALLMVINRGLSNPGAPPSSGRASVMVTVKADPVTGEPQGAAVASTGQVFTARAAGRFACVGDLTPIVLGEYGEPLQLGRTVR